MALCRYTTDRNRWYSIILFRILLSKYHIPKITDSFSDILRICYNFRGENCVSLTRCTPYITFACITYRLQHEAGRYLAATAYRVPFVHVVSPRLLYPIVTSDTRTFNTALYFKRVITTYILTSPQPFHGVILRKVNPPFYLTQNSLLRNRHYRPTICFVY
jgi:hypothetical protein